jgi:hypothetical protein
VARVVQAQHRRGQLAGNRLLDDVGGEGVVLPVEGIALLLGLLPVEVIPPLPCVRPRVLETRSGGLEPGMAVELGPRQFQEPAFPLAQALQRPVAVDAQTSAHVLVEVLQQGLPGLGHARLYLLVQFGLEPVEGGLDLVRVPAGLVDLGDATLDVHAGFERAQDLVAHPEDAVEEPELFAQDLEHPLVRLVAPIEEVDDHDVVLLAVAMAPADTLFDPLGIPGQVVVYHE